MIVLPADLKQSLGVRPFEALMNAQGEIYRKQPLRETARIILNDQPYFIKKHWGISLAECFKNWFSGRMPVVGAKPEWLAIQALTQMGIPTTPLIGYGQEGQRSFVLTQALDNCISLEELCLTWNDIPPKLQEKRALIKKVAHITRTLHENGWVHRDLYLCHFLRDQSNQLHLIDLHRMQQPRLFKQRWIIKDLAGLLFSSLDIGLTRNDVLYFVKEYTKLSCKQAMETHRDLFKKVLARANKIYVDSHHDFPPQAWMHLGHLRLPQKLGDFQERFVFPEGDFKSISALRVLPKRRWVMKGHWKNRLAVLKLFTDKKAYQHEIAASQALQQAHILTPELLYQGQLDPYYALIYTYIDQASPLSEFTAEMMKTMIALHQAGLVQSDCHRDNFLQRDGRIYVLDPGGIEIHDQVNEKTALDNLALLYAQWPAIEDDKHFLLFAIYLQAKQWTDLIRLQALLKYKIAAARIKARNAWLKKIFRDCTQIKTKSRFTYRYCTRRDFDSLYTQTLFNYPEAYFHEGANFLNQGNSATVIRTHMGEYDVVIKRFNRKNWIKRIKRYFTQSKAARAWKMAHAMETIGIATPKPLAMIEKRFGFFGLDSYFISEYVAGERLDHLDTLADCSESLNILMDALDTAMCEHGDLKASNLLWDGKILYLLDTDSARFYSNRRVFQPAHEADWNRLLRNWR
jgi:heptose I phosphotransferase